jgi:hypothetical protein
MNTKNHSFFNQNGHLPLTLAHNHVQSTSHAPPATASVNPRGCYLFYTQCCCCSSSACEVSDIVLEVRVQSSVLYSKQVQCTGFAEYCT